MKIVTFNNGLVSSNSYAVINNEGNALLIDAGSSFEFYMQMQQKHNFVIQHVLLTHGHFDHTYSGLDFVNAKIPVYISQDDKFFLYTKLGLALYAGQANRYFHADKIVNDGDILELCGFNIKVIATPGHTAGSVCYLIKDSLFTGDTLFYQNIGRSDFPTGDYNQLISSIKTKLFTLSDGITVYPGHENTTTIGQEKLNNPYVGKNAKL